MKNNILVALISLIMLMNSCNNDKEQDNQQIIYTYTMPKLIFNGVAPGPGNWKSETLDPQICVDSSNCLNLVWSSDENATIKFSRSIDFGSTWSIPQNLFSGWEQVLCVNSSTLFLTNVLEGSVPGTQLVFTKSEDNGLNWNDYKYIFKAKSEFFAHIPAIATDNQGTLYVSFCLHDHNQSDGHHEIYFSKSTDNGDSWSEPRNLSNNPLFHSDYPAINIDYQNNINLTYWQNVKDGARTFFIKSDDGGNNWSSPRNINNDYDNIVMGMCPIISDSTGKLYVVYSIEPNPGDVFITTSIDGGNSWINRKNISHSSGDSYMPKIAMDHQGVLHVVWYDNSQGIYDIYISHSSDGGATWTDPQNLSNSTESSFAPSIDIDSNGKIYIVWDEGDISNKHIYFVCSEN